MTGALECRGQVVLPLTVCSECHSLKVKALRAKALENDGCYFYICPSGKVSWVSRDLIVLVSWVRRDLIVLIFFQHDGNGCGFWYWEDDYEKYLIKNRHVLDSYVPVFCDRAEIEMEIEMEKKMAAVAVSKLVREKEAVQVQERMVDNPSVLANSIREAVMLLKVVVLLLKVLAGACSYLVIINLYGLIRSV